MSDETPLTLIPTSSICPRCHNLHEGRFYGPCDECRIQLKATWGNVGREIKVAEYVPKINVTPNSVAAKDD